MANANVLSSVSLPITNTKVVSYDKGRGGVEVILFSKSQRVGSRLFHPVTSGSFHVSEAHNAAHQFAADTATTEG